MKFVETKEEEEAIFIGFFAFLRARFSGYLISTQVGGSVRPEALNKRTR